MKIYRLLIVEDSSTFLLLLKSLLNVSESYQFEVTSATTLEEAKNTISIQIFDAVILDLTLPDSMPENTFSTINQLVPETAIIVSTASRGNEFALDALKKGAQDYLLKSGLTSEMLCHSIVFGVERKRLLLESAVRDIIQKERLRKLQNRVEMLELELKQYQASEKIVEFQIPENRPRPNQSWLRDRNRPILIVDDVNVNITVTSHILKKFGYNNLLTAQNGLQALDQVQKRHPSMVLMDINMPVMDGICATTRIRNDCPASDQPVIVALTAAFSDSLKETCLNCGMNEVLSKPISRDQLEATVSNYLS